jgi:hypothetical protein
MHGNRDNNFKRINDKKMINNFMMNSKVKVIMNMMIGVNKLLLLKTKVQTYLAHKKELIMVKMKRKIIKDLNKITSTLTMMIPQK